MAIAFKCDRCGVLYTERPLPDKPRMSKTRGGVPLDLCNDCTEQLKQWLYAPKNESKKEVS